MSPLISTRWGFRRRGHVHARVKQVEVLKFLESSHGGQVRDGRVSQVETLKAFEVGQRGQIRHTLATRQVEALKSA